ncbi:MAG: nuclear transport factor 2 family protein [Opitutae bacterium]|nr:nuclear transport factor 2 family protein [Opitutae bacterium]
MNAPCSASGKLISVAPVSDRRIGRGVALVAGHRPALLLSAFVASLFLFAVAPAFAQRTTLADGLKAAVLRADETRLYAMLAADTGALDDMLAADCLYVHSTGAAQTKAQLLHALKTGTFKYTSLRYTAPPLVRLYGGEAAVITGTMQLEVQLPDGKSAKPTVVVTAVYVMLNDRWQLASYQSTNAPAK